MKHTPLELLMVHFTHAGLSQRLGRLAREGRQILFEYDPDFVEHGVAISPLKLPLKRGIFFPDDQIFSGLFGVFNDSLPDGWGRLLLDRHVEKHGINRRELSALDRLAFVGQQGMGCLTYEPVLSADVTTHPPILLDILAEESREVLSGDTDVVFPELLALNGGSTGARPKIVVHVSLSKDRLIHGSEQLLEGFESWMIKFPSLHDPKDIGAIEYAYNLMAQDAGVHVPNTHLFTTDEGQYFGVKRFDRDGNNRMHMHSLCGLIHADYRVPSLDYDTVLRVVAMLTKNNQDVEQAFALACFNVFAHNRDDHSKNISFLLDASYHWRLSPAYDLTFSSGPQGEHSTTVMGEGRAPSIQHLQALGRKHGLKQTDEIIERVQFTVSQWKKYAVMAGVSVQSMQHIARVLLSKL